MKAFLCSDLFYSKKKNQNPKNLQPEIDLPWLDTLISFGGKKKKKKPEKRRRAYVKRPKTKLSNQKQKFLNLGPQLALYSILHDFMLQLVACTVPNWCSTVRSYSYRIPMDSETWKLMLWDHGIDGWVRTKAKQSAKARSYEWEDKYDIFLYMFQETYTIIRQYGSNIIEFECYILWYDILLMEMEWLGIEKYVCVRHGSTYLL